ncbi:PRC-barrel domain-containing protein [Monashia sp. NPDC004114]
MTHPAQPYPARTQRAQPTREATSRPNSVRLDVMLRLLDHQIVGPDDELLGNVDDVEMLDTGAGLFVTGIAIGPASLAQRLPGRIGDWLYAIWRRLHPDPDPQPLVVPIERVTRIDSAVEVDQYAARILGEAFGLEVWLRKYVVSRIPGAKGGGDDREAAQRAPDDARAPGPGATRDPLPGACFASAFVGREVVDESTHDQVGKLCEIHTAAGPLDAPQTPMQVTHLQYGQHLRGSELGYNADSKQGPWVVASLVRHWQRGNRVVPATLVRDLGGPDRPVVVSSTAHLRHPYAVSDQGD